MDLTLVLHFAAGADSAQLGRVLLWDGGAHIQDDRLDRVAVAGGDVVFTIPVKQTDFEGRLYDDGRRISGRFVFPDGSQHPVDVKRVGSLSHRATLPPSIAVPVTRVRRVSRAAAEEDLAMLMSVIADNHPAPFRFVREDSLHSLAEAVAADLPETLSVEDLLRRLHLLVASIRCVHTDVRAPAILEAAFEEEGGYLPAGLRVLDGRVFATDARPEAPMRPGTEVISIDGRPVATVLDSMIVSTSADGRGRAYPRFLIDGDFARAYARTFGRRQAHDFEIRYGDGSSTNVEIPGRLPPDAGPAPGPIPTLRFIDDGEIALLRVPTFGPPDLLAAVDTLRVAFAGIRDAGSTGIIVDVRGNQGGHPRFAADLISYLTEGPFTYFVGDRTAAGDLEELFDPVPPATSSFEGRLVVLMDGGGVSTTGHFLAVLR
jgi:hypothetical protein